MARPFHASGPIPTAQASEFLIGFEEDRRTLIQYLNRRAQIRLGIFGPEGSGKTSLLLSAAPDLPTSKAHIQCSRLWPHTPAGFYQLLMTAQGLLAPSGTFPSPLEAYRQLPVPKKGAQGLLILEDAHTLDDIDPVLLDEIAVYAARSPYHLVLTGLGPRLRALVDVAIELKPFSDATAADFLRRRFQAAGLTVDDEAIRVFNEFCRGLPDALQRLGHETYEIMAARGKKHVRAADVDEALSNLVDHLPSRSLEDWAALRGITRDIFIAMCLYDLESPTAIARRIQAEPKNVIVLLHRLATTHGVVERVGRGLYQVRDLMLKHYVRKEWSSPVLR